MTYKPLPPPPTLEVPYTPPSREIGRRFPYGALLRSRRPAEREDRILNVLDYGAKGDGVTIDTQAFTDALADADAVGGAVVYAPRGTYMLGASLTIPQDVSLRGDGIDVTVLKSTAVVAQMFTQNGPFGGGSIISATEICDLTIYGDSQAQVGLLMEDTARWSMRRVKIERCTVAGLRTRGALVFSAQECQYDTCVIGLDIAGNAGQAANLISFRDCVIVSNTTYGGIFDEYAMICFEGCDIEQNGTAANAATGGLRFENGVTVNEGVALLMRGCWFEGNSGHSAIRVDAAATAPALHIFRDLHIIGGTRTYGLIVSGANLSYVAEGCVAQNAATADFQDDTSIVRGVLRDCLATTVVVGTDTTLDPTPLGTDLATLRYARLTLALAANDYLHLSASGARLGIEDTPDTGVTLQVGSRDGTQTTGTKALVRGGAYGHPTGASRGAGFQLSVPNVGAAAANTAQLEFSFRNNANNGEGPAGGLRVRKTAALDTGDVSLMAPSAAGGNSVEVARGDMSTTADDIRFLLYDVTAGTLKRVSRGAADSAGAGFRQLRIPN